MCTQLKNVSANLWCDDQADFWIGNSTTLNSNTAIASWNWFELGGNTGRAISISTTGQCCDFVYIVAYSNHNGQNGLLIDLFDDNNNLVLQNSPNWEVFPTEVDQAVRLNGLPRPTQVEVEQQIGVANTTQGWQPVTAGGANGSAPFSRQVADIDAGTNYIWFDSGDDPSGNAPFNGFNHKEYLIFRHPIRAIFDDCEDCNCDEAATGCTGCNGCNEAATEQNEGLIDRAGSKANTIPSTNNNSSAPANPFPVQANCLNQAIPSGTELAPSFYLHWGDSASDQIETHDTEVFYITVCNDFRDIQFKGLRIINVALAPSLPIESAHLVPDRLITIDCLEPCSCQTREFAILTRDNSIAGNYTIEVEYCYDEIVIVAGSGQGGASFPIEITRD